MGLRAIARRHPWVFWPSALVGGSVLILVLVAVAAHRRGMARLREVVAEQRAAGLGCTPTDFLARMPALDQDLQDQAWKRFGNTATWPGWSDDIAKRMHCQLAEGAAWQPIPDDSALLAASGTTAAALRGTLADDRLVLSIAGWLQRDPRGGIEVVSRYSSVPIVRGLAEWLALAGACGDAEAEADLRRLRRALNRSACLLDLMLAIRVQSALGELRLGKALRGRLPHDEACRADPEEVGTGRDLLGACGRDGMLGAGRVAEDLLAGRSVPVEILMEAKDPTGVVDWVKGPGDLALSLSMQARQLQGQPMPALATRWYDIHSSFDPRFLVMDVNAYNQAMGSYLRQYRLLCLAAALAADGRERLPSDAAGARAAAGATWPGEDARYERTERGFHVFIGSCSPLAKKHDRVVVRGSEVLVEFGP